MNTPLWKTGCGNARHGNHPGTHHACSARARWYRQTGSPIRILAGLLFCAGIMTGSSVGAPAGPALDAAAPAGQLVTLYPNQDFEAEKLGWGFWPSESRTRMELDTQVVQHGRQSLRLTAVDAGDRAFALAGSAAYEPEVLYRVSVYVRRDPGVLPSAVSFFLNCTEGPGKPIKERVYPSATRRAPAGEWECWSGFFSVAKSAPMGNLLLGVEHTVGRVWFDNIIIEKVGKAQDLRPDVWTNLTIGVEIGSAPLRRLAKHRDANTPVYQMATRYNDLMWRSAALERDLRELERCLSYAGQPSPAALRSRFQESESWLDRAFRAYADALRAKAAAPDAAFTEAAGRLSAALDGLGKDLAQARRGLLRVSELPARLGPQPRSLRAIEADGRMNRILFGVWSPTDFSPLEQQRFGFEFHSSAPGEPKVHSETEIDFSNVTEACDRLEQAGFGGTFAMLSFGVHERLYAPQWLLDKHRDEPDFFKLASDGTSAGSRGSLHSLNYFHPAVQRYIQDYLGKYAEFCRKEPRILFYEVAQEAYPGFANEKGMHLLSYGPHMVQAFQNCLQGKYRTIEALNQEWGAAYAGFAAIQPPPDPNARRWQPPTPLTAEFADFAEQAYLDYLKRIYDTLKASDPGKPVVSRHSALLSRINGARIFETCDVLSFHRGAPEMNLSNFYLNSLNRFAKRSLGYMEDFWGKQEEADRVWDERAQRRGLEKHVIREGFWGRTLQMKWYAYTSGSYLFQYNGNWFNPRTDLTTWRYCAPGLQTAMRRLEVVDWMLTHSRIPPFKLLILQPSASMRIEHPANAPYGEMMSLHGLLAPAGLFFELAPEEYVADGRCRLDEFAAVILPQAKYLSPSLQRLLADYTAHGGLLVALGRPGSHDDLARACTVLQDGLHAAAPGADWPAADKAWDESPDPSRSPAGSGFASLAVGKGRLVALHGVGALTGEEQRAGLVELLARQVPRSVWSENCRFEVLLRVAEDGGRYLCILNPNVDEAAEDTVRVSAPVKQAVDVWAAGGCAVPVRPAAAGAALKLRLGPGEATVVYLGS